MSASEMERLQAELAIEKSAYSEARKSMQSLADKLHNAEAAKSQALEALRELRQQVEDTDLVAQKDVDADGWITAYHFKTGAWHRLLAKVREPLSGSSAPQAPDSEELLKALRAARQAIEWATGPYSLRPTASLYQALRIVDAALSMKSEGTATPEDAEGATQKGSGR